VTAPTPSEPLRLSHTARRATVVGAGLLFAFAVVFACWFGGLHSPLVAFAIVLERAVYGSGPALLYVGGAVGLGRLFRPLFRGCSHPLAVQSAAGLALSLWLSHLLAWQGALGGHAGPFVALAVPCVGLLLAAHQLFMFLRGGGWEPALPGTAPVLAVPAGIMFGAALFAPGWLWDSEFGGYDALSYHLQLPAEWLALGRLVPLHHNVYSYLPSGVEAAFMHLGAMWFPGSAAGNLTLDEGYRVYGCQVLVACVALQAAWLIGCAASTVASRGGSSTRVGPIAAGLAVATPWFIVTGSLAYNDVFVLFFFAAALLAVAQPVSAVPHFGGLKRGVLAGVLVGAACIAKPTSILFVAIPIAITIAIWSPPRHWASLAAACIPVGLVMLLPGLIRDYQDSHNPVFPFAAWLFPNASGGTGAWPAEQVARFARSHAFDGSALERLRLLILPDANDPAGPRHRGLLHVQWGAFFPLVGVCAIIGLVRPVIRRAAIILTSLVLVQLALWLTFTHIQSRFLLPLIVPGAALCALAIGSISPPSRQGLSRFLGVGAVFVQACFTLLVFAGQHNGHPAALFPSGIEYNTGADFKWTRRTRTPEQSRDELINSAPARVCSIALPPTSTLYLLGDATPFYFTGHIVYNTTYDTWLLGEVATTSTNPDDWTKALKAKGITHVLINFSEIDRLTRSGFIDPRVKLPEVERWARASTMLLRDWPNGSVLVALPETPTPAAKP
jgi:hypothetical protein